MLKTFLNISGFENVSDPPQTLSLKFTWNFAQACLPPWKHYWPVRCVWGVTCWGITGRREKDNRENMLKFLSVRQGRMNKNSLWSTDIQRMRAHGVCSESWTWADWTSTDTDVSTYACHHRLSKLICFGDFLAARQSKMHGSQCFVRNQIHSCPHDVIRRILSYVWSTCNRNHGTFMRL